MCNRFNMFSNEIPSSKKAMYHFMYTGNWTKGTNLVSISYDYPGQVSETLNTCKRHPMSCWSQAALNPIWLIPRRGFSKRRITAAAARNLVKLSIFLNLFFSSESIDVTTVYNSPKDRQLWATEALQYEAWLASVVEVAAARLVVGPGWNVVRSISRELTKPDLDLHGNLC